MIPVGVSASDALYVLRSAVGSEFCHECVCDVDASGSTVTTDALFVLRRSVGQNIDFNCAPCC
ncbi:MAG TPA: hypothetical protein VEL28_14540 [Candidatus Binatia bacterium]|nr:hypothetical protein [Candidatus Binatia bacterium]